MYYKNRATKTTIDTNDSIEGEPIEAKLRRIMTNKEPITDNAPLIYTERKDGVQPGYDIRTDRFEVAVEAMDKIDKSNKAKRQERHKPKSKEGTEETGKAAADGMKKEDGISEA